MDAESSFFDIDFEEILLVAFVILLVMAMRIIPRLIARVPFVDPGEVKRMLDAGEAEVVVDVRSVGDFNGKLGHIPGAVSLPFVDMGERLKALGPEMERFKDEPIFVNCRTENIAAHGARRLKKAGFTKVAVVKGGMRAWKRKGLPIERDEG
jgi:rhodanese-related sulfurtransferase